MVFYEAARAVWPDVDVPADLFAEFVAARGRSHDTENASDLYLACACVHGVPRAVEAFEHTHMLVFHPRDSAPPYLQALFDAGWSTTGIVVVSQLVAFLSYQIRVVAGLRVLNARPA